MCFDKKEECYIMTTNCKNKHSMIVIYDLETNGFSPMPLASKYHRIVQIAARSTCGVEFNSFVDIGGLISPMSTNIHHITNDDLVGAPTLDVVLQNMFDVFGFKNHKNVMMVAHNNNYFDKIVLLKEMNRLNVTFPCEVEFFDTLPFFRQFYKDLSCGYSLSKLYNHFYNEEFDNAHRADSDVNALSRLFCDYVEHRLCDWYVFQNSKECEIIKECITSLYYIGPYRAYIFVEKLNVNNVSDLKLYWKANAALERTALDDFLQREMGVYSVAQRMLIIWQILEVDIWSDEILNFLSIPSSVGDCLDCVDYYVKYRYFLRNDPPNIAMFNRGLFMIKNKEN